VAIGFGKGLSRESLKDIFAAARYWRGATESSHMVLNTQHPRGVASFQSSYLQRLLSADVPES
jgi:hypothetical protein